MQRTRIIIADDETLIRMDLREMLTHLGYLVKPFREADLAPAIEVALARFQEFRELEKQVGDIQVALETRKLVDRAKGILMTTQGLSESDAFRKIQKMSMDTRRPMKDIAQALIITYEAGVHDDKTRKA